MKKTISINLNGLIYTMDEDAYEKLRTYLDTIRSYFSESEGCDEIMADIEARVAEMFQERVTDRKEVINTTDVDHVISVMGEPEQYLDDDGIPDGKGEPKAQGGRKKKKRLYRDSDSSVLAGVCSGIAHYFGWDPVWVRIVFVVFIFFTGLGVPAYIILWIALPEAKTTAEKLEMRGEPVTAENIASAVKDGFKDITSKEGVRKTAQEAQNGFEKFFEALGQFFVGLFKALGKLIGFAFVVVGMLILGAIVIGVISDTQSIHITDEGISSYSFTEFANLFFHSSEQAWTATIGLLLLICIPIMGIVYGGIKLLFGIRNDLKIVGLTLACLWLVGLLITVYIGLQVGKEFRNRVDTEEITYLQPWPSDSLGTDTLNTETLYLMVNKSPEIGNGNHWDSHFDDYIHFDHENGKFLVGNVELDIRESENDSFAVVVEKQSCGNTRKDALAMAKNIKYNYAQQDSVVMFDPYWAITMKDKWRAQMLEVTVLVPKGKAVHLGNDMDRIIYNVQNVTDTWDHDMAGKTWTMTEQGLECIGCDPNDL